MQLGRSDARRFPARSPRAADTGIETPRTKPPSPRLTCPTLVPALALCCDETPANTIAEAAKVLKTRTLTNFYDQRPAWLDMAHRRPAAYGWPGDMTDAEVLAPLFALNQVPAAAGR